MQKNLDLCDKKNREKNCVNQGIFFTKFWATEKGMTSKSNTFIGIRILLDVLYAFVQSKFSSWVMPWISVSKAYV